MSKNRDTIRVLIVDDHLIVREGLRLILETGEGIEVVGEAPDGQTAIDLLSVATPDVMLLDLRMPEMGGIEVLQYVRRSWPHIKVIILTTYNDNDLMVQGIKAGASGYLLKDVGRDTLLDAMRVAARGEMLIHPKMLTAILASSQPGAVMPEELTDREQEILLWVANGDRSKEIAFRLNITERTVRGHLTNIYTKLGVDSRAAAVAIALSRGLIPLA